MHTKLYSECLQGINGIAIEVEVNISNGLPRFDVVGLPDQAVSEARERVIAAIINSNKFFPAQRITINLAPADIKKTGSFYDLAFALGILLSSGQIFCDDEIQKTIIIGELALDGTVRGVNGVFSMLLNAKELGINNAIIPHDNLVEADIIKSMNLYPVKNLNEAIDALEGNTNPHIASGTINFDDVEDNTLDFVDVKGQEYVKRAAIVASAGAHNFMMIGPPGSGKTLIAKRIPTILPMLTFEEALEITKIYSTQGLLSKDEPVIKKRPFRIPHHTASYASLVGGGHNIKAGEITLAHNGILFLDEFPEFQTSVLQTLREPMEERSITITRTSGSVKFPANFTLIAAMNPCPCGYYGDREHTCKCSEEARRRYVQKLSGPLLDRIDLSIEVPRVEYDKLTKKSDGQTSKEMKAYVERARRVQQKRFREANVKIHANSQMSIKDRELFCILDNNAKNMLDNAVRKLSMSARSYDKILKVSRTIADLEESENISVTHIAEALQYKMNI